MIVFIVELLKKLKPSCRFPRFIVYHVAHCHLKKVTSLYCVIRNLDTYEIKQDTLRIRLFGN